MNNNKVKQAFSLIELSTVIIIIGLLTAGIIQGKGLIYSARVNSARAATAVSVVPKIDGLVAWYETSLSESFLGDEAVEGEYPTTWYDISPISQSASNDIGNRNTLSRTADSYVVYRASAINNLPSIQFYTANDAEFSISSLYQGTLSRATIFLVFNPQIEVSSTTLYIFRSYDDATSIGMQSDSINLYAGSSVSTGTTTNAADILYNEDYILSAYFNGSTSEVYINDTTNLIGNGDLSPGTGSLDGLKIGATTDGTSTTGFTGFLSEVIIYDRPLNFQERQEVMRYLSQKYKIAVSNL